MIAAQEILAAVVTEQPYPLVFATLSGAHLYGFPSANSDYDLRGVHILPVRSVIGLSEPEETIEISEVRQGIELDLVTHDVQKFLLMLLKRNGYVLEQLFSPLIVYTTPAHENLKAIMRNGITRNHAHHYLGFTRNQWELFEKENPRRVKPLLYVYRVLLTGIHLMQTGEVEANLITLNARFGLAYIDDLVAMKLGGAEQGTLKATDLRFYQGEYERLTGLLEAAHEKSNLPETPECRAELNDFLVRLRLEIDKTDQP
ncbi:MAG TPA: nucleotidyltransferase domain-containing protein [Phototrophicaceae bacterium]|nr:nucleotidyltransferase domain-containing protein [Phototrophicaceae bacterium]